jgi:hypothetical protein
MNKKRIDYDKVYEVIAMNLSERKSVQLLNENGIKISKTMFHKLKEISKVTTTDTNSKVTTTDTNSKVTTTDTNSKVTTDRYEVVGHILTYHQELRKKRFSDLNQLREMGIPLGNIYDYSQNRCLMKEQVYGR